MWNTNPTKKRKVRRIQHEAIMQKHFFHYMSTILKKYRKYIFSIPNGGKRDAFEAKMLRLQGATAGVWDIFFAFPVGGYHGMFIECKHGDNKLTEEQEVFGKLMSDIGYKCVVCYSFDELIKAVEDYIGDKL